jgi:hypothetical protein
MSENFEKSKPEMATGICLPHAAQDSTDLVNINKRRHLARFAMGTPVLLTLASRPVLAGQCLSNMMSGNLSDPTRGQCSKGWSPGGWGQPGGTVSSFSTVGAWDAVGLKYGYLANPKLPNQYDSYTGGATLANVSTLNKDSLSSTLLLRELLTSDPNQHQLSRHLVCAYLNAKVCALSGSDRKYPLTPQQVLDLASGVIVLPTPGPDLQTYLGSTWA